MEVENPLLFVKVVFQGTIFHFHVSESLCAFFAWQSRCFVHVWGSLEELVLLPLWVWLLPRPDCKWHKRLRVVPICTELLKWKMEEYTPS